MEPLPKRTRARRQIDAPLVSDVPLPDASQGRKHSQSERDELRDRHTQRHSIPEPIREAKTETRRNAWWGRASVLVLAATVIGGVGFLQFAGSNGDPPARPARVSSPTPTTSGQVAVLVFTATPTPSISPTPSPPATNTPSPTPTANPAFRGRVICLDPGHGGSDRGFTRAANDIAPAMEEAELNLEIALVLRDRLIALGFTVVMTRTSDVDVNPRGADVNGDGETQAALETRDPAAAERAGNIDELQARINVCNEASADLLVSMHFNGFDDPAVSGYETWFSSARPFAELNRTFARFAFDELGRAMGEAGYNAVARRVNDDVEANARISGAEFDRYIITGPAQAGKIVASQMPGAIVEALFVSNDADAAFLATPAGRDSIVVAYERAIVRYFDTLAD